MVDDCTSPDFNATPKKKVIMHNKIIGSRPITHNKAHITAPMLAHNIDVNLMPNSSLKNDNNILIVKPPIKHELIAIVASSDYNLSMLAY